MANSGLRGGFYARAVGIIVASTLALTASFVGVVSLVSGAAGGIGGRFPFYVLALAVAFVGALLLLDHEDVDGPTVMAASAAVALTTFVLVALGVEGVVFAVNFPERLIAQQLVVYFVAAGLICTGLVFWGLNHWREFTGVTSGGL